MSSGTGVRLPVIDFSTRELKPGSPDWDLVKVQVRQALEEYGCFEALFDKVLEVRDVLFGAMEELFDLPSPTKQLCTSDKPYRGYHDATAKLLRESMSVDEAHIAQIIDQDLTNILWPQGNISFSKTIVSFTQLAAGLEKTIRRMVLESFGVEKYMDELNDATNYNLRALKYGSGEPPVAAGVHTDKGMITVLYQNEVNGLEIQTKDGEWIKIKPSPRSFVIMIGDSLSAWLNGRFSPVYHRVVKKGNKVRYSIILFSNPRGGYSVKAPEELVDGKNGLLFKPFDYEEYLQYFSVRHLTAMGCAHEYSWSYSSLISCLMPMSEAKESEEWTVFVDNLSKRVSKIALREPFRYHGRVERVFIPSINSKSKYKESFPRNRAVNANMGDIRKGANEDPKDSCKTGGTAHSGRCPMKQRQSCVFLLNELLTLNSPTKKNGPKISMLHRFVTGASPVTWKNSNPGDKALIPYRLRKSRDQELDFINKRQVASLQHTYLDGVDGRSSRSMA
ncbi:hypothetical protein V6N11_016972 [Hibiscus sabdariffa]|uniref:Fe2OG dioxygenase domain-containing protein n=1 Tax=Hibiscus sabdariffa TaxID=183260 RepID=A0ABR2TXA0_9ROSI